MMRTRSAHRARTIRLNPLTPGAIRKVSPHLQIPLSAINPTIKRLTGKPAIHTGLALRQPHSCPDEALDDTKHNHSADSDSTNVRGGNGRALGLDIQKGVGVEALGVVRHVRQAEVERQHEDAPPGVDPQRGGRPGDDDFEEGEAGIHGVFGNVGEGVEWVGEPHAGEDDAPVDGRYDEGVGRDGRVVKGVQGLQGARKPIEKGRARAGVGEGVERCGEVVKGQTPVGEDGKVGEFIAG